MKFHQNYHTNSNSLVANIYLDEIKNNLIYLYNLMIMTDKNVIY